MHMVVIYQRNTPLPKVRKGLDGYILIVVKVVHGTCPWEDAFGCLILAGGQGRWTRVQVSYNRETYL
jgi:hypothetical protein